MRSSYPGRKVSVIPTKLQFTILDSARDMVAGSQKGKCELKYLNFEKISAEKVKQLIHRWGIGVGVR